MKSISSIFFSKPTPTCTALSVLILFTVAVFTLRRPSRPINPQNPLTFRRAFLSSATNATVSSYLRSLTSHPHLAGTQPSLATARLVESHFQSLRLETRTVRFSSLLSYPIHASVVAQFPNGTAVNLPLTEPGISGRGIVPPYHAYSPSGFVRSKPVFANYGRNEDYTRLLELGVNVSGCVVMVRRSNDLSRGGQVRAAERAGAAAVLIYGEEGQVIKGGVERGTVMKGVGDPTTPGWAVGADGDGEMLEVDDGEVLQRFPKIPSLPLSMDAAELVLSSLGGASVPPEWRESLMSEVSGVGPGPVVLNFTYLGEKKKVVIQNVFGVIRGSIEPDRYVLLGNHRDAWTYGAVDPNSGTAALLDIARRYSLLIQMGWNPRRTVILCSWDAEEFGMVGSTEWVEQNIMNLGSKAVAYLNVDCAAQGPGLFASATPQLDDLLVEVTKMVGDPDTEGATVFETWTKANKGIKKIQRLGGVDSDFAPFVQRAGIPSVDIYFGKDFPVYHTAFDTYEWMKNHGDPTFQRHVAAAGIWGLLALHLADDPILPLNYCTYAKQLQEYVDVLSKVLVDESSSISLSKSISTHPLTSAVEMLHSVAEDIEIEAKKLRVEEEEEEANGGDVRRVLRLRSLNDRLMLAERGFLDNDGLPGNRWFKHLIYGPCDDPGSKLGFFPGITDAIAAAAELYTKSHEGKKAKEEEEAAAAAAIQHQIWRAARAIQRAADVLRGDLFTLP